MDNNGSKARFSSVVLLCFAGATLSSISFIATLALTGVNAPTEGPPPAADFLDWPVLNQSLANGTFRAFRLHGAGHTRVRPRSHDVVALAVPRTDTTPAAWRLVRVPSELGRNLLEPHARVDGITPDWIGGQDSRRGMWAIYRAVVGTTAVEPPHLLFGPLSSDSMRARFLGWESVEAEPEALDIEIAHWVLDRWGLDPTCYYAAGRNGPAHFGPPDLDSVWGMAIGAGIRVSEARLRAAIRISELIRSVVRLPRNKEGREPPMLRAIGRICRAQFPDAHWWKSHTHIIDELAAHDDAVRRMSERRSSTPE